MERRESDAPRSSPYEKFHVRVCWDGRSVAGFSTASGLAGAGDVVTPRERSDVSGAARSAFRARRDAITLQRGVTHDAEFERWARDGQRRDITVELYDETGRRAIVWRLTRGWISKYQGPDLDATGNDVAIEELTLEHEGLEPDTSTG